MNLPIPQLSPQLYPAQLLIPTHVGFSENDGIQRLRVDTSLTLPSTYGTATQQGQNITLPFKHTVAIGITDSEAVLCVDPNTVDVPLALLRGHHVRYAAIDAAPARESYLVIPTCKFRISIHGNRAYECVHYIRAIWFRILRPAEVVEFLHNEDLG